MTFDHLRLFRDIAYARSVSRGAAMNGLSQSAASQHLHDLERQFGAVLLDRSTRPFTITAAGKLYLDFCREVLRRKDEFEVGLERLKTVVEGAVRVAAIYSVGLSEMTHLRGEFLRRYPGARVDVEYLRPEKVYEAVLSERADLGIVSYPEGGRDLAAIPWREERMVLAAAPGHPLTHKPLLELAGLNGVDFIAFDEGLRIRQEIDRFLRDAGVEVNITMHFDNIQSIKEAVAVSAAVSILPARVMASDVAQGRIVTIPLAAELVRPLGIVYRRRRKFHRAAELFLAMLEEIPAPESAAGPQQLAAR